MLFFFLSFKVTHKRKRQIEFCERALITCCLPALCLGCLGRDRAAPAFRMPTVRPVGKADPYTRRGYVGSLCGSPGHEHLEYDDGMKSHWELQGCLGDSW